MRFSYFTFNACLDDDLMGQSVGSEVSLAWDNTGELLAQPDSPESAVDIEAEHAKLDLEPNSDIQSIILL